MLETLDYIIRIGSTPTILYFNLYLYSAYTQHTTITIPIVWSLKRRNIQLIRWRKILNEVSKNIVRSYTTIDHFHLLPWWKKKLLETIVFTFIFAVLNFGTWKLSSSSRTVDCQLHLFGNKWFEH